MMNFILVAALLSSIFPWAIGLLTLYKLCCKSKHPMDESNRINRIIIWWTCLNKPHLFVGDWAIFTMDVEDQVKTIGETENE